MTLGAAKQFLSFFEILLKLMWTLIGFCGQCCLYHKFRCENRSKRPTKAVSSILRCLPNAPRGSIFGPSMRTFDFLGVLEGLLRLGSWYKIDSSWKLLFLLIVRSFLQLKLMIFKKIGWSCRFAEWIHHQSEYKQPSWVVHAFLFCYFFQTRRNKPFSCLVGDIQATLSQRNQTSLFH